MRNKMLYKYYLHKVCAGVGDLKKKISSKDLFLDSESQNFFQYYYPKWAQSADYSFLSDGCLIDPPITDYFECRASVNGFCCKCGPSYHFLFVCYHNRLKNDKIVPIQK